jgi:phosphohistidine phosphatase
MDLFLVRHAAALPESAGVPDAARPLSLRGRDRFERAVRGLRRVAPAFDLLVHSPLLRAVETAQFLTRNLQGASRVSIHLVGAPTEALLAELDGESVAVVGHSPWLDALASWLVVGDRDHADAFPFRKGGVLWLVGGAAPGGMRVHAALPPRILRRVG